MKLRKLGFKEGTREIRMVTVKNPVGLGNIFSDGISIFLQLQEDGPLKLFVYYQKKYTQIMSANGTVMTGYSDEEKIFIMQKENGEFKLPKHLGFKKDMIKYVNDCPVLVELIKNKTFKKSRYYSIAYYYNNKCGQ